MCHGRQSTAEGRRDCTRPPVCRKQGIKIGDSVVLGGEKLEIVGTVALSDYSTQFQNNSDMMFDATNFGVAIVTKGQYDKMDAGTEHFIYSWKIIRRI